MAKKNWNNCSPTGADITLFGQTGHGSAETYTWEITDENEGQKSYFIDHHFSTRFLEVHVFDVNGAKEVYPGITYPEIGRICVWFSVAPVVGQVFRIIIVEIDPEDLETA